MRKTRYSRAAGFRAQFTTSQSHSNLTMDASGENSAPVDAGEGDVAQPTIKSNYSDTIHTAIYTLQMFSNVLTLAHVV